MSSTIFAIIVTEDGDHLNLIYEDDEILIEFPSGRDVYYDEDMTLHDVLEMDICGHSNYDIRGCSVNDNDIRGLQYKKLHEIHNQFSTGKIIIVIS